MYEEIRSKAEYDGEYKGDEGHISYSTIGRR